MNGWRLFNRLFLSFELLGVDIHLFNINLLEEFLHGLIYVIELLLPLLLSVTYWLLWFLHLRLFEVIDQVKVAGATQEPFMSVDLSELSQSLADASLFFLCRT